MAGLNPARRYKMLSERNRAKEGDSADASSQIDFKQAMHDENETGVLSIMNSMFSMQRLEKSGRESEGFKLAVIQWSSAYGVAYSLMLTIAFSMLVTKPLPPGPIDPNAPFLSKDWRFPSERLDAIMPLLYYFFAAAACCDSAWGMLICAEWGVRGGVVPADMYEKFIRNLRPDPKDPDTKANTMWAWRCFEPRAVHDGLPTCGVFCPTNWKPDWHLGWAQTPSWDPFYFVDRTVMSLFCAAVCLVYMNNGALASGIILYFFLSLRGRVRFQGQVLLSAMFKAHAQQSKEDGVGLTRAEMEVARNSLGASGAQTKAAKSWSSVTSSALKGQVGSHRPSRADFDLSTDPAHMC